MAKRFNALYAENGPLNGFPIQRALDAGSKEQALSTADSYTAIRPTGYETGDLLISIRNMSATAGEFVRFRFHTSGSGGAAVGATHQYLAATEKIFTILKDGQTHIVAKSGTGTPSIRIEVLNADII